jgi:hypothetical protein
MKKKEKISHIPSTGRAGEVLAVAAVAVTEALTLGISEADPEKKFILSIPFALALYYIRELWLAAKEREAREKLND